MNKLLTLIVCLFTLTLAAQQTAQSSLFNFNTYDFNPAVAGIDGELSINADLRRQWVGLAGAPLTQSINAHVPVYFTKGGFGLAVKNTTYGLTQNVQAALGYNQILTINENILLSIGASGGLMQHTFRGSDARTPEGIYEPPGVNHVDTELSEVNISAVAPLLNAGIVIDISSLRIGLSADNLLSSTFDLTNNQKDFVFNQVRHYYGYLSYEIGLDNDLVLIPSLFVKAETAELQTEINVLAEFKEKFMLGFSYRGYNSFSNDALVFQGGFRLSNNLRLGYAFDYGLSELSTAHNGSHEILISYNLATNFGKGTPPKIIFNPRFL